MFLSKKGVPLVKYHRTSKANHDSKNDNTKMKKQINPTTKAYLIRGAFYLLLLLAVCAIPFALAQRNAAKQSVTKPAIKPNVPANRYLPRAGQSADGVASAPAATAAFNNLHSVAAQVRPAASVP